MTTFEERHPSMAGKYFEHDAGIISIFRCYSELLVDETQLDKEIVRKAILKVHREYVPTGDDISGNTLIAQRLIMELGL